MAGRYTDWHHLELVGDRALAIRYLSEGRKWLGFLLEQRKLGSQQHVIEKRNADGVLFRAEFAGELPILTINVSRYNPKSPLARVIEGFIVRPSSSADQYTNVAKDHVLLQPNSTEFTPWFYDAAAVPAAYNDPDNPPKLYSTLFPNGIGRYGNVDWRNADESVVLSWMGPSGRYFGYGTGRIAADAYVFLHGQVLYDATALGALNALSTLVLDSPVLVRGACMRGPNDLYVVLRDDGTTEALVRYKVISPLMQRRSQAGGIDMPAYFFADATVDYTSGELLWYTDAAHFNDGYHPYFFNTTGTEARRVYVLAGVNHEARLVLDTTSNAWTRVLESHTFTTTTTSTYSRRLVTGGQWDHTTYHNTGGSEISASISENHPSYVEYTGGSFVNNIGDLEIVPESVVSHAEVPSAPRMLMAVDFWDGSWRYAESYLISDNWTSTKTMDFNSQSSVVSHESGTSQPSSTTWDLTCGITGVETRTRITEGVRTPFADVTVGIVSTNKISLTYDIDYDSYSPVSDPFDPANVTTKVVSVQYSRSGTSSSTQLNTYYMDLRFDVLYYQVKGTASTVSAAGGTNTDAGGYGFPFDLNETSQQQWETKLIVGGALVEHLTENGAVVPTTAPSAFTGNTSTATGMAWVEAFRPNTAMSGVTLFYPNATELSTMGFDLDEPDGNGAGNSWHALAGSTSAAPASATSSSSAAAGFFSPSPGDIGSTVDFQGNFTDGYGSWQVVKKAYVVDQQNPDHRAGADQFVRFSNRSGLPALIAAYPAAARLYPVGYLSRVIVVS